MSLGFLGHVADCSVERNSQIHLSSEGGRQGQRRLVRFTFRMTFRNLPRLLSLMSERALELD